MNYGFYLYSRWNSSLIVPQKRRFENQKTTKKKQALYFCLLFDVFVLKVAPKHRGDPHSQKNHASV